eukprot:scaffold382632_cov34-Prasinocladus_malaysianus.AAC.3
MSKLQGRSSASIGRKSRASAGCQGAAAFVEACKGDVQVFNKVLFLIDIGEANLAKDGEIRRTVETVVDALDRLSEHCSTHWAFRLFDSRFKASQTQDLLRSHLQDIPNVLRILGCRGSSLVLAEGETVEYGSANDAEGPSTSWFGHFASVFSELETYSEATKDTPKISPSQHCPNMMEVLTLALQAIRQSRTMGTDLQPKEQDAMTQVDNIISAKMKTLSAVPCSPGLSACQEGSPQAMAASRKRDLIVLMSAKPKGDTALSYLEHRKKIASLRCITFTLSSASLACSCQSLCVSTAEDEITKAGSLRGELGVKIAWVDCQAAPTKSQSQPSASQRAASAVSVDPANESLRE